MCGLWGYREQDKQNLHLSSKHRLFTGPPQEQIFTNTPVFKAHMMVIDIKTLPSERTHAYCMWSWSCSQPQSCAENTVNTPYTNSLCLKFKLTSYLIHKIETKCLQQQQQKFQVNPKHNSLSEKLMKLQTPQNDGKSCKELTQQFSMSPWVGSSGGISGLVGTSTPFLASGSISTGKLS